MAMVAIHDDIDTKKLASRMIMQIHDELLFDVPQGEFGSFAGLVRERMEHVLKLKVPIVVSVKKGKNWLEMEEVQ
jgi:DNA polymerase-1